MKKTILSILSVVFATALFAQTSETLKTGTIVEKRSITNMDSAHEHPSHTETNVSETYSGTQVWNYAVKDNSTGIIYEAAPFGLELPVGAHVDFTLRKAPGRTVWEDITLQRGVVLEVPLDVEILSTMQKARHDAMMATIQNAR